MNDDRDFLLDLDAPPDYELGVEDENHDLQPDARFVIQTVIDLNTGRPVRFWFGTLEQYNALPEIYGDVSYNILERSCYVGQE